MPRDFTPTVFRQLLTALKEQQYTFQTFAQFLKNPEPKAIVLRHDVDARKLNSLHTAQMEAELGIVGTYNFRMVPQSFDEDVIRKIADLGHEIGYHYEDLVLAARAIKGRVTSDEGQEKGRGTRDKGQEERQGTRDKGQGRSKAEGLYERAIGSFERNLERIRQVAPVETICMHGSPLSRYDNRKIWNKYSYKDYGIIGEPYFDVDFRKVLYLTDTGRRWDGGRVSVRDKVGVMGEDLVKPSFHSTFDIIQAAQKGILPTQIMINVHPQRWDDRYSPWAKELVLQNLKNIAKRILIRKS